MMSTRPTPEEQKVQLERAAQLAKKWGAQFQQLGQMGYGPEVWIARCVPLLEKYKCASIPGVNNSYFLRSNNVSFWSSMMEIEK